MERVDKKLLEILKRGGDDPEWPELWPAASFNCLFDSTEEFENYVNNLKNPPSTKRAINSLESNIKRHGGGFDWIEAHHK